MDRFGLLCRNIYEDKNITQRELASVMHLSLGTCNRLVKAAQAEGLIIRGGHRLTGGTIDTHNEHRIAMMAAAASLISDGTVTIQNAEAVKKSYPAFFDVWKEAGLESKLERK